jgi:anti-anti-sigma factor
MAMARSFSIRWLREGRLVRAVPEGELDLASATEFGAALPALEAGDTLAIDLRHLAFIDSAGIHVLMELDVVSRRDGWSLVLIRGSGAVQRVLDICRVGDRIRTVDAADRLVR